MKYDEICTIETRWVSDVFEIEIKGRLTYENVQKLKDTVGSKICESQYYMINLSQTSRMDSTGLGLFIAIVRNYLLKSSKLVVVNSNPNIQELFVVSRLNVYFAMVEHRDEAFKLLYDKDHEAWKKILHV